MPPAVRDNPAVPKTPTPKPIGAPTTGIVAAPKAVAAGISFGPTNRAVAPITSVETAELTNSDKKARPKDAGCALLNNIIASSGVIARSIVDLPCLEGKLSRIVAVPLINPSYVKKLGSFSISSA